MRILQLHCNQIEYTPIKKEISMAEDIHPKTSYFDEIIVVFITVEKNDNYLDAKNAALELRKSIKILECSKILLYPYLHLSSTLSSPTIAFDIIKKVESYLVGFDVHRAPFGWTKTYKIEIKKHPLAERFKIIKNNKTNNNQIDISTALKTEPKLTSKWYVITPDKKMQDINNFNFKKFKQLELFLKYETSKKHQSSILPSHIKLMKKLAIADYEPASDSGNMRFYPNGKIIKSLIEKYVTEQVIDYGGIEVETPIMYDVHNPSLANYFNRFPARQYNINSDNRQLILRFAACFGQFLMVNDFSLSYKTLPLKIYELTRYSFRREQSGELVGLRRLRAFTMPDCHAFCRDMKQAIDESKLRFILSKNVLNNLGIIDSDFELIIRLTKDFFEKNKELVYYFVKKMNKPILIEIWEKKFFYFVFKWEFNYIDNLNNASALSTDQIDIENGKRFDISFINEDNTISYPIILHNSPSGAIERVMYALLENAAKNIKKNLKPHLPLWLSPTQVRLIPLKPQYLDFCDELSELLTKNKIRVDIDDRNHNTKKKVMLAETEWIHYILIIGENEINSQNLFVRDRKSNSIKKISIINFINMIKNQVHDKPFIKLNFTRLISKRPIIAT